MNTEQRIHKLAAFTRNSPNPLLEFASDATLSYYNDAARRLASTLGQEAVASILPPNSQTIVLQCLLTGESHVPLAATPHFRNAAPITGYASFANVEFGFDMKVTRVAEHPRITQPFSDESWERLNALGEREAGRARLRAGDVRHARILSCVPEPAAQLG